MMCCGFHLNSIICSALVLKLYILWDYTHTLCVRVSIKSDVVFFPNRFHITRLQTKSLHENRKINGTFKKDEQ